MAEYWIYLSPHFDDVALSLGGLVWQQVQNGNRVEIWTLCAGGPPAGHPLTIFAQSLHARWQLGEDASRLRAEENDRACRVLGAVPRNFSIPDCIYRRHPKNGQPAVSKEEDLFKPYTRAEFKAFLDAFATVEIPQHANLVVPLAVGDHRDHWLTRAVAECVWREVWHYIDYPYAVRQEFNRNVYIPALADVLQDPLSASAVQAWQQAIACHRSQISTFWKNESEMAAAIQVYARQMRVNFDKTYLWKF